MGGRSIGVLFFFALAGCGTQPAGEAPPPEVCKTPGAPSVQFTDVTEAWGVTAALGTSVRAGDLDGDGYPDLIATIGHLAARETAGGSRMRFLLLNRPDPSDPTGHARRFIDTTAESGLLATRDGVGGRGFSIANLGDLDGDGDLDVVVCPYAGDMDVDPCAAFLNDGKAHFTLAPEGELEAAGPMQCASASLADFDRDGVLDFWPGTYGTIPYLFRGNGDGTFHDVAAEAGLPRDDGDPATHMSFRRTFGVTACDLDGDGDEDVLLADYGREANQVWIQDAPMHFVEQGIALGIAYDNRMDYSDDQSYRCYCQANAGACPASVPAPPSGYCPGRGWVAGQSDQPWRLGGNTFSIVCGDLDDDGDADLMTAEIRHGDVGSAADPSELIVNQNGSYVRPGNDVSGILRTETGIGWNEGDMMPVFADVDLDGRKDIYLTSSDYPGDHGWLWRQKPDGSFEDITAASGAGHKQIHGVALVDLDLDGDLDLVAGTSTARSVAPTNALHIYRNDGAEQQNWVRVRLRGAGAGAANVSAIGARVRVTAGGRTQTQEVSGGYGHNSIQNDLELTFGLGATCAIDRIEVRWPDAMGTVSTFEKVRANYRVELRQGDAAVHYLK